MSNPVKLSNRMTNMIAKCFVCGKMIKDQPEIKIVGTLNGVQMNPQNAHQLLVPMNGVPVCDPCFKDLGLEDTEPSNILVGVPGGMRNG